MLISSTAWILGKVSSFAQEASVSGLRSLEKKPQWHPGFQRENLFGVDVWGRNWENGLIFFFFFLLVDESNMVTLVSALKLSKGIPLRHFIPWNIWMLVRNDRSLMLWVKQMTAQVLKHHFHVYILQWQDSLWISFSLT